jgi:hypothetical protein
VTTPTSPPAAKRLAGLRALGIAAPRPRFGYAWPHTPRDGLRRVLPLRRWKTAIGVAGALFALMCVPLFALGLPALHAQGGLVNFSTSLLQWFWLLGWSAGAALPGLALAVLLFGREVVSAVPGCLRLRVEVLGLGLGADYPAQEVHELRLATGDAAQGTGWRGTHLAFDYHAIAVPFGCDLDTAAASALCLELQRILARPASTAQIAPHAVPAPPPASAPQAPAAVAITRTATAASRLALLGLVAANLLPLIGVLALGWRVGEIMLIYWAESVIIGLINIAKLIVIGRWAALFYAPFFVGHYGAFMAGHLMFVYMIFLRGPLAVGNIEVSEVLNTLHTLWPALLGLTVSHLLSFVQNFIGRREYLGTNVSAQMNAPYKRVFIMQFTIIIGGMLTLACGSSLPALGLLIALKLLVDINAHHGERQRAQIDSGDEH